MNLFCPYSVNRFNIQVLYSSVRTLTQRRVGAFLTFSDGVLCMGVKLQVMCTVVQYIAVIQQSMVGKAVHRCYECRLCQIQWIKSKISFRPCWPLPGHCENSHETFPVSIEAICRCCFLTAKQRRQGSFPDLPRLGRVPLSVAPSQCSAGGCTGVYCITAKYNSPHSGVQQIR